MLKVGCVFLLIVSAAFAQSVQPSAGANQSGSTAASSKAGSSVCVVPLLSVRVSKDAQFPIERATPRQNVADSKDLVKAPVPVCATKPPVAASPQTPVAPTAK